jgi:hypothetical protein
MAGKSSVSRQKKQKKRIVLFFVLLPLIGLSFFIYSQSQEWLTQSQAQAGKILMLYPNPEDPQPNLQLKTFPFITLPPAPTNSPGSSQPPLPIGSGKYCSLDDLKPADNSCTCLDSNAIACPAPPTSSTVPVPNCPAGQFPFQLPLASKIWYCIKIGTPGMIDPNPPAPPAGCQAACIAKPVVYLYPEKTTLVDVSVKVPGEIFISDPLYPRDGWQDVEARPDGTLYYQGKRYSELFYESTVTEKIAMPETGIIIAKNEIEPKLREAITQLGLNKKETNEFLEFWVPLLRQQNTPYIFFSILPPDVKESVDSLTVLPQPDTRIEFIAYFKPLQQVITIAPLQLPNTPPARIGFTEVEWGGTLMRD